MQARGQNEQAARNLGVPVDRITVMLFMLTSALAAVAGIIQVARFSSVDALRGEGMELQAVAVTVIGGTLLSGGYGSVIGTVLGSITFGMIQVGLVLAGAPGHFFRTLTGVIVVGAVILNTSVARRMAARSNLAGRLSGRSRCGRRGDAGRDDRPGLGCSTRQKRAGGGRADAATPTRAGGGPDDERRAGRRAGGGPARASAGADRPPMAARARSSRSRRGRCR